jgi:hypothetical protein
MDVGRSLRIEKRRRQDSQSEQDCEKLKKKLSQINFFLRVNSILLVEID